MIILFRLQVCQPRLQERLAFLELLRKPLVEFLELVIATGLDKRHAGSEHPTGVREIIREACSHFARFLAGRPTASSHPPEAQPNTNGDYG